MDTEITANFDKNDEIYIIGDFNGWTLNDKMKYKDGKWKIKLSLSPGNYGYLFYSVKNKIRYLDSNNVSIIYKDGIRASKLTVEDCRYPVLKLTYFKVFKNGYEFTVTYTGKKIDFKRSKIYLNGYPTKNFSYKDKEFHIIEKNKENSKYSYLFKIIDVSGYASNILFVPIWVEDKKFKWKDAFVYQIMTDRFKNGDESNDAPFEDIDWAANWQGGDFRGIIDKIEDGYFDKIGVNAIWISSPVLNTSTRGKGMGNDGRYYAPYHSYWPVATGWTDFNRLDLETPLEKHFGNEEELKELVNKAHKKGIRVLFDIVPNHVHTDSFMWKKYSSAGWFHLDENQNPYICGWDKPIVCWFNRYLADINHKNNNATMFVVNHFIWLAKEFNIDGFRIDAVRLMITDFTRNLRYYVEKELETTGIKFYLIGENYTAETEKMSAYKVIGQYLGKDKLDGLFNFPLFHEISRTFFLLNEDLSDFEKYLLKNSDKFQKDYYSEALMGNFFGNHDLPRAISMANGDFSLNQTNGGKEADERVWENKVSVPNDEIAFRKLTMAQTIVFTMPDIPFIYQGDEFGMPGANDPDNRRMMKFNFNLSVLQKKTLERFEKISLIRKKHNASKTIGFKTLYLENDVWSYLKTKKDDFIIVVFNRKQEKDKITLNLEDEFNGKVLINIFDDRKYEIKNNKLILGLDSFETLILSEE